jgi:hypothetical protein
VVRELRDGEDVDQVEEQLDWLDLGLLFVPLAQPAEVGPRYSPFTPSSVVVPNRRRDALS